MTTTDEYVPSDEQVRGRYCDGTYAQTGHTTEGEDFDAWLARVREDAEAELDSWMTRAYEAEGKLWRAEARIRAVQDALDTYAYTGIYSGQERISTVEIRRALDT